MSRNSSMSMLPDWSLSNLLNTRFSVAAFAAGAPFRMLARISSLSLSNARSPVVVAAMVGGGRAMGRRWGRLSGCGWGGRGRVVGRRGRWSCPRRGTRYAEGGGPPRRGELSLDLSPREIWSWKNSLCRGREERPVGSPWTIAVEGPVVGQCQDGAASRRLLEKSTKPSTEDVRPQIHKSRQLRRKNFPERCAVPKSTIRRNRKP